MGLNSAAKDAQSLNVYSVWSQILKSLANVRSVFSEHKIIHQGLRSFTLRLISPATEKLGWEFSNMEDFLTGQLRTLLISAAGSAGHQK